MEYIKYKAISRIIINNIKSMRSFYKQQHLTFGQHY